MLCSESAAPVTRLFRLLRESARRVQPSGVELETTQRGAVLVLPQVLPWNAPRAVPGSRRSADLNPARQGQQAPPSLGGRQDEAATLTAVAVCTAWRALRARLRVGLSAPGRRTSSRFG